MAQVSVCIDGCTVVRVVSALPDEQVTHHQVSERLVFGYLALPRRQSLVLRIVVLEEILADLVETVHLVCQGATGMWFACCSRCEGFLARQVSSYLDLCRYLSHSIRISENLDVDTGCCAKQAIGYDAYLTKSPLRALQM